MDQKRKQYEPEPAENDFDVGYKLPQTKDMTDALGDALREEHRQETEEDEKQGNKKKKKRPNHTICCCGAPHCRIGPFVEKRGEEGDA